jgi:SAM-dependent methyltransferase
VSQRLPFRSGWFEAAWSLGVLCTTTDKAGLLDEVRRVLRPAGRLGLLVFVASGPLPADVPEGNDFPTEDELRRLLAEAGFTVVQTVRAGGLPETPIAWQARADRVEAVIAERHGDDPRWSQSQQQSAAMGRLLRDGDVAGLLVHAVAE